jgi:hypothetical protein
MNTEIFATSDLHTIAAITASQIDPIRLERDGGRVTFIFTKTPQLEKIVEDFWEDRLELPALSLLNTLKNLKTRIYNTK